MNYSLLEVLNFEPIRKKLDLHVPPDLFPIIQAFSNADEELYIVGGAVRDTLLGKIPKDYDLSTGADPAKVIKIVSQDPTSRVDLTGKDFGVVRVKTKNNEEFEIATWRTDNSAGRRPDSVTFTTIENDVKRRDLTINALFYNLATHEVVDYVGGIADLENGVIRAVGDPALRFQEDKLRILRAVRFAARMGSDLDPKTAAAIRADNDLAGVSPERTRDEFAKGLRSAKSVEHFLTLITDLDLWPQIFPGLSIDEAAPASRNFDVQVALLTMGNGPKAVSKVLHQLKYTRDEIDTVKFFHDFLSITPELAPSLKKAHTRLHLTPKKLSEFARLAAVPEKLLQGFLSFTESPPTIRPMDLMAQGLKGPQIGRAMNDAEVDVFRSMTETYHRILRKQTNTARLLSESMKRVEDLPADIFVAIDVSQETIGAELVFEDWTPVSESKENDTWGDVSAHKVSRYAGPSLGAYTIYGSSASRGWGPFLYDIVMEIAYEKGFGLTPDRGGVTSAARRVWQTYLHKRPDVRVEQLDFEEEYFYHITPDDPRDDSRITARERDSLYSDDLQVRKQAQEAYLAGPMSKVYYSNGTPTLDKLRKAGKLLE